ncbi:MAG: glutamate--cysteine ligase [Pelagibacteraceae bacterium]|nr:glutamate--cysteine ligase [Pelagibacteraceae bacterium]|tara:strand:+ start:2875 stop:4218 length:1344 start_codon:yes stop_codon:yes gene_type:complete
MNKILRNKNEIIEYFEKGSKPKKFWKIGTEHEKFIYNLNNLEPINYHGKNGIKSLFKSLKKKGWKEIFEGKNLIALKNKGSTISLEPRCQIELSGGTVKTIHETCREAKTYLDQLKTICVKKKLGILGLGYYPRNFKKNSGWVPKKRYSIMKKRMKMTGSHGLEMMSSTCCIQTNLDYASEDDMFKKVRIGFVLQPFITALFANSPIINKKKSKFLSYRSYIWNNTDKKRCGIIPEVFSKKFTFDQYVSYLLKVPMYFVVKNGKYNEVKNQNFEDFLNGKLKKFPKNFPNIKDLENHISTIFTDVRIKQYIEMRGADSGAWNRICALPAFWVGLLYNKSILDQIFLMIKNWTYEEIFYLNKDVQKYGLKSKLKGKKIQKICIEILKLAKKGLNIRKCLNKKKENEEHFLDVLFEIANSGVTPAEDIINNYIDKKNNCSEKIFIDNSY